MTNLVLVMPYRAFVTKARQEGFRVGAVWDPRVAESIFGADAGGYLDGVAAAAADFRLTDFADQARYRADVRAAAADLDAALVHHVGQEESMLDAARFAEELGLAVNPAAAVALLNDKLALRELLTRHGVSPVRYAHAARPAEVAGVLDGFRGPVVVKPTALSGSRAVRLVRDRAGLDRWAALAASYGYTGPVLVEEYLDGPEYSVETISVDGVHHVVGVTRKRLGPPPLFVESGHRHPAPPGPAAAAMGRLTRRMLALTGYRTGPAHTEIRFTRAGPRIVESQARLGGDRIPQLVQHATGVDLERAVFAALAGRPPAAPTRHGVAAVHYFDLPIGEVTSLDGVEAARALPGVHELSLPFAVGGRIPPTVDWRTRHGFVVVSGATAADVDATLDRVRATLRVGVRPAGAAA